MTLPSIDPQKTSQSVVAFIKQTCKNAGFSRLVLGVSGGIDSATSLSLAVKALGKENVYALQLPYKNWHEEAKMHARLVLTKLEIPERNIHEINITPIVDSFVNVLRVAYHLSLQDELDRVRMGNIMARSRMIVLFDLAKKLPALVLGTENKSEHYLGYYTRFGDEASDIEPLRGLYKTQVYQLAKYLGVPPEILDKAPTAGLWPGQTDEGEFGFSYQVADEVMYHLLELKTTKDQLVKQGIARETIEKIETWLKKVSFKHHLPLLAPELKNQ